MRELPCRVRANPRRRRWTGVCGVPARILSGLAAIAAVTGTRAQSPDYPELGVPFVQHFTPRDFRAHSQSMGAAVDARGILHVANLTALLEYDGESWRHAEVPGVKSIYAVAIDTDGTVFLGLAGDLGRMRDDGRGGRTYESLREHVPAEFRDAIGAVRRIVATPQGVVFQGTRVMLRWRDGRFRGWQFESERPAMVHAAGADVFAHVPGRGLLRLQPDDTFAGVVDDASLAGDTVNGVFEGHDGGLVLAVRRRGLVRVREGVLEDFVEPEVQAYLAASEIIDGTRLRDGALALATIRGGVVVVDARGALSRWFTDTNGLRTPLVARLAEDAESGLWCLVENGISRVEMASPITVFNEQAGLKSTSCAQIIRHDGSLYLGTLRGVHRLRPASGIGNHARFEPVEGTSGQVFDLWSHDSGLLAGVDGAVVHVVEGEARRVWSGGALVYMLRGSRLVPDVVYVGTRYGLAAIRRVDGRWIDQGFLPGVNHEVRSVWEDPADGTLWFGTISHGAGRVEGVGRGATWWEGSTMTAYAADDGLFADGMAMVEEHDGRPVFSNPNGLLEYASAEDRFVPMRDPALRPRLAGDWRWVFSAADAAGNRWGLAEPIGEVELNPRFGYQPFDGEWVEVPSGLLEAAGSPACLLLEGDGAGRTLWLGGSEGVLRWDVGRNPSGVTPAPLHVELRHVGIVGAGPMLRGGVPPAEPVALPFRAGRLRFEYAAPGHDRDARVEYATRLDGLDRDWSAWSDECSREFSYLPEGSYRFRVRARTAAGGLAESAAFGFVVAPPWYRSWLAFLAYAVAGGGAIAGLVRWRGAALRRRNEELERIVTDRTAQLQEARDTAEQANRAKSAFLANMSHELRTPLNGILGYAQILLRDASLSPRNRERLRVLSGSGEHLLRLINEVLDISKVEAGRMELREEIVDLPGLVRGVGDTFTPRVVEKGLRLAVRVDPAVPPHVVLDGQKLGQVLFNLVGNAVKFTDHGSVQLDVSVVEARLRFAVVDTGPGIAPAEQAAIFEPFYQSRVLARHPSGTGLGLAIASRMVALMGGALRVSSEAGAGSRFSFDLPFRAAERATGAPSGVPGEGGRVVGYEGSRRRVLVVDDIAVNRAVLVETLEPLGFEVFEADGGASCLALFGRVHPDVILLDMRMQPMDGRETLLRLRDLPGGTTPRVISFSASAFNFTRSDALALGCDDFVAKPFREAELLEVLGRLLGLTWVRAGEAAGPRVADASIPPDRAILNPILGYARSGDAASLRAALDAQARAHPEHAALFRELDTLAAAFRMQEIRRRIEEMLTHDDPS